MFNNRGFVDKLYGVAYPLSASSHSEEKIQQIRLDAAQYCLNQAKDQKPYNVNFLNSETEEPFTVANWLIRLTNVMALTLTLKKKSLKFPLQRA